MWRHLFIVAAFIALIFFYIRYVEKRSLYIPYGPIEQMPDSVGLEFKEVNLKTPDGFFINAWWVPSKQDSLTILFFHGNGGNLSHRLEKIKFFHDMGLSVFIIDYRGYGKSSGIPSESGLYRDAQSAYDYLCDELKISPENIVLYGESLGGAVAIELASKNRVRSIVTEGAFTNIKDMARLVYSFIPNFFIGSRFDSLAKVPKLGIPALLIHSRNDEIVPFKLGEKLFNALKGRKELIAINGGHNDSFYGHSGFLKEKIRAFLHEK